MASWQSMNTAPRCGRRFWGRVNDDAVAMFWHEGFGAFVSRFNRMTMAPGYLINGKPYEDHSPSVHEPDAWMEIPSASTPIPAAEGRV